MSEEYFYLKVRFVDAKAVEDALPKIQAFFAEGEAAKRWSGDEHKFAELFPTVAEYLNSSTGDEDELLEFGDEPRLWVTGDAVCIESANMRPSGDWGPLVEFIKMKFKAEAVGWINEGRVNPFDLIRL